MKRGVYGQMCQTFIDAWDQARSGQIKPGWNQVVELIASSPVGTYVSVVSLSSTTPLHFLIYAPAWAGWSIPPHKTAAEFFPQNRQVPEYERTLRMCASHPCGVYGFSNFNAPAENVFVPILDDRGGDAISIFSSINPGLAERVPAGRLFETRWFDIGAGVPVGHPFDGV